MAKIKYENWSGRVFPGFCYTILSSSNTLSSDNHFCAPDGFYLDVVDEADYRHEVCREWAWAMEANWDDNPVGMRVGEFVGLWSPREYNFSTDRITVEVKVNLNRLKAYCWRERASDFDDYLHKHWSSRDGFWSFIPNRLSTFKETYRLDKSARSELVDIMVEWYLLEHIDWEGVQWDVYEKLDEIAHSVGIVLVDHHWNAWRAEWDNDAGQYVVGEGTA